MASPALRIEVRLTRCRIAYKDVENDRRSRRRAALSSVGGCHTMYEFCDSGYVGFRNIDCGHARVTPGAVYDGANQLTPLVVQHELGSQQIRSLIAAASEVRPMTAAAVDTE